MSSASHQSEGVAEKIGGKIKEGIGKVTGDERLQAEGKAKEAVGEARVEQGKAEERAEAQKDKVVGAVKNRVGAAIGDEKLQAEGKARELEGEEQLEKK